MHKLGRKKITKSAVNPDRKGRQHKHIKLEHCPFICEKMVEIGQKVFKKSSAQNLGKNKQIENNKVLCWKRKIRSSVRSSVKGIQEYEH